MNFFLIFGVFAVLLQSFDCAPLQSSGSSVITVSDGRTIKKTYTNGKTEYFIDDKPATEQQVKEVFSKAKMENGVMSMGSVNIDGEMTPEQQEAFGQQMEHFEKNIAKAMEDMREQMAQAMGQMEEPGWPFGQ